MVFVLQIATIIAMIAATFLTFVAFGEPRKSIIFTRKDKEKWDSIISSSIGSWFTLTNIIGTLTSLATVYVFFIGSAKLFGHWVFLCALTLWLGSFLTVPITRALCAIPRIKARLEAEDQSGAVIAALFWDESLKAQRTASIIKYVSLINISSVIWLELALFADIAGKLLYSDSFMIRIALLAFCAFTVTLFTLRYGLRGFVFADMFQAPIIAISATSLVVGAVFVYFTQAEVPPGLTELTKPLLDTKTCTLFAFHVLFVNGCLVLVTESHWLRLWIFQAKEITLQVKSIGITSIIWILLAIVGLFTFSLSKGQIGEMAIVGLMSKLSEHSYIYLVTFWAGGMAALFSTADSQIYSFLLVYFYDPKSGKVKDQKMDSVPSTLTAAIVSLAMCILYAGVRFSGIPFEKIVFALMPLSLNVLPAFACALRGIPQHPSYILMSIALYSACSVAGFARQDEELAWTLTAAFMPIVVAGALLLRKGSSR